MRIQSINQSNYQHRNVGFKSTYHAIVHLPCSRVCSGYCGDVILVAGKSAVKKANPSIQQHGGSMFFYKEKGDVSIFVVDESTDPTLAELAKRMRDSSCQPPHEFSEEELLALEKVEDATIPEEIVLTRDDINLGIAQLYNSPKAPAQVCRFSTMGTSIEI